MIVWLPKLLIIVELPDITNDCSHNHVYIRQNNQYLDVSLSGRRGNNVEFYSLQRSME